MAAEFVELLPSRRGHFRFESGHHGDLWLELDLLWLRPERLGPFVSELARRLGEHCVEVVCGPLVGGAFLAELLAPELGAEFHYAERFAARDLSVLYGVDYRLPIPLREHVRGKRVAVVDDVVNAGSAVGGTLADVERHGGVAVAIGALLTLGETPGRLAAQRGVALAAVASLPSHLWAPDECPLCAEGRPLDRTVES